MILNARLADLLVRWDKVRSQGQAISPEELCRDCPDMLEELKKGIRALTKLDSKRLAVVPSS
jgi:hypothetical protein